MRRGASESAARPPASRVDGLAGLERHGQRRRASARRHDLDAAGEPGGDAADQAAAADRDQQGVEIGQLFLELQPERALADQGLGLVEGVDRHRAGLRRPCFARGQRIGVALAPTTRSAPYSRMRAILAGDESGTKILAGMPSIIAA